MSSGLGTKLLAAWMLLLLVAVLGGVFLYGANGVWNAWSSHERAQENIDNAVQRQAEIQGSHVDTLSTAGYTGGKWVPRVRYQYTFENRTYTASSYYAGGDILDDQAKARNIVDRYEAGDTVTAYVNEQNPSQAYLQQRSNPTQYHLGWGFVASVIALVGGGGLAKLLLEVFHRKPDSS